jgi:hypothetical protein
MKYLITESKLKNVIYRFLDNYQDLKGLEEFENDFFDYDNDFMVVVIEFGHVDWDPIIQYYKYPSNPDKYNDKDFLDILPVINIVDDSIKTLLYSMFGNEYKEVFLQWFKDTYGYPANDIM